MKHPTWQPLLFLSFSNLLDVYSCMAAHVFKQFVIGVYVWQIQVLPLGYVCSSCCCHPFLVDTIDVMFITVMMSLLKMRFFTAHQAYQEPPYMGRFPERRPTQESQVSPKLSRTAAVRTTAAAIIATKPFRVHACVHCVHCKCTH